MVVDMHLCQRTYLALLPSALHVCTLHVCTLPVSQAYNRGLKIVRVSARKLSTPFEERERKANKTVETVTTDAFFFSSGLQPSVGMPPRPRHRAKKLRPLWGSGNNAESKNSSLPPISHPHDRYSHHSTCRSFLSCKLRATARAPDVPISLVLSCTLRMAEAGARALATYT